MRHAGMRRGGSADVLGLRPVCALLLGTCCAILLPHSAPAFPQHQERGLLPYGPQRPANGVPPTTRAGGFRAAVEMVRVPVIVVDKSGAFVSNLQHGDFAVNDRGRRHAVDHFVSDAEPVSVGVLLDASAAMEHWVGDVKLAVERIAGNLRTNDELFLVSYGPGVATLCEPTRDKASAVAAMQHYATWEGADRVLYDAIDQAIGMLQRSSHDKRSLVVIGADDDTASTTSRLAVQQRIHRVGVTIHAISLTPRTARTTSTPSRANRLQSLPEVVRFTGGLLARRPKLAARYGGTAGWLEAAGRDISAYVKHQCLLHYAPQDPPRPGTWREIRVLVRGEHREVRARSGYMR